MLLNLVESSENSVILHCFLWEALRVVWHRLEDFMELSIFNFVVVHNRKIPLSLTETHEADLITWAGYKRTKWRREVDNENDEVFSPWVRTSWSGTVL